MLVSELYIYQNARCNDKNRLYMFRKEGRFENAAKKTDDTNNFVLKKMSIWPFLSEMF